jgi:hypothetical protein
VNLKILSRRELDVVFRQGSCPAAASLLGPGGRLAEWRVDMLTGPVPSMGGRVLRHRKQFWGRPGGSVVGCNVLFRDLRWGWFSLGDRDILGRGLIVDYDQPENGLLRDRVRDYVRQVGVPGVLLGRFYLMWRGYPRFVGYFSMTRLPELPG